MKIYSFSYCYIVFNVFVLIEANYLFLCNTPLLEIDRCQMSNKYGEQVSFPRLQSLTQEESVNGQLIFTLTFQSMETPYKVWADPER